MANLLVLVGLPASGKSTFSEGLEKLGVVKTFSSDAVREEKFGDASIQEKNGKGAKYIFGIMDERVKKALYDDYDVVYDATSLTRKTRMALLEKMKGYYDTTTAVFFDTLLDECLERNSRRDRVVPVDVILKMNKNLEEPSYDEGFDRILIVKNGNIKKKKR